MSDAYTAAGVDTGQAERGVGALVSVLRTIDTGAPSRSLLASGHYASVLKVGPNLGIALSTDGVGSKLVLAEQSHRLETVGIDCVAMNVNDVICVGARPIALLDYLAVERVDEDELARIATGLKEGAEQAGVEIPGGELAVVPELIRGHPSPHGFDLCATCVGVVALDRVITGEQARSGDVLIGLPSSGLHSNGYTLARHALLGPEGLDPDDCPPQLGGASVLDALLEPTTIYVRAVLELLDGGQAVHGLAHITGDGLLNLLRLADGVGFEITDPLPIPGICQLACERAGLDPPEAHEVFNMGCGFVVVVREEGAAEAAARLSRRHPGARVIGRVTGRAGQVSVPARGIVGDRQGLRAG